MAVRLPCFPPLSVVCVLVYMHSRSERPQFCESAGGQNARQLPTARAFPSIPGLLCPLSTPTPLTHHLSIKGPRIVPRQPQEQGAAVVLVHDGAHAGLGRFHACGGRHAGRAGPVDGGGLGGGEAGTHCGEGGGAEGVEEAGEHALWAVFLSPAPTSNRRATIEIHTQTDGATHRQKKTSKQKMDWDRSVPHSLSYLPPHSLSAAAASTSARSKISRPV